MDRIYRIQKIRSKFRPQAKVMGSWCNISPLGENIQGMVNTREEAIITLKQYIKETKIENEYLSEEDINNFEYIQPPGNE